MTRVDDVANRLNSIAVPAGRSRLAMLGAEESGSYNFYSVRLARGDLFSDYDRRLAEELIRLPQPPAQIHEIGGGFGNFGWLMAGLGVAAVSLECDRRRFDAGEAIWGAIRRGWPEMPGSFTWLNARFPAPNLEPGRAWAISTNLVFTSSAEAKAEILGRLKEYETAIIDVDRFLVQSREPEQRAAVLAEFVKSGIAAEPFLDLGSSACFYRCTSREG